MTDAAGRQRWLVLAVGLLGLIAGCAAQYGLAYLIPALRIEDHSLEAATTLVIAPVVGVIVALIAWGAVADRFGERLVLAIGLAGEGVALLAAAELRDPLVRWLLLFASGASGAAIHAASGRLILGWFGRAERGLAMGIRQMGQPLGVASAALVLPALALSGIGTALVALAIGCLVSAAVIGLVVRDPIRPATTRSPAGAGSPYRTPYLWRIHVASACLVIPQFAVAIFAFDYLVNALGWSLAAAGALLAVTQLVGAGSRLAAGYWSDRVGARLGPMRLVAFVIGVVMALLAVLAMAGSAASVVALALAAMITVSPNGLAFTAVAERAGPRWAGRALGIQNTFQNLVATAVATPLAFVIGLAGGGAFGYGIAFAAVVAFPFLAAVAIPAAGERTLA
ncbi:MAG TPA: MFS transporter [Candidatus Limnocylindria bacterium]|nr:MFS transporter [Candidatus Limnocylindria bacterium]